MESENKIQKLLFGLGEKKSNKTGKIFLNIIKNEFIKLQGELIIPKIPVKELTYDQSVEIVEDILDYIPEFLYEHSLLKNRIPLSEQHTLQFVKEIDGKFLDFVHMFKIDLKFGGNSSNVIEKGNTELYPAYKTDRLYYKSQLVPVSSISFGDHIAMESFKPLRIFDSAYVESDRNLFTSVVFEDINVKKLNIDILEHLDISIFGESTDIYPFVLFNYFTVCFNVLYPTSEELEHAVKIFEPIFLSLYHGYKGFNNFCNEELINKHFPDSLEITNGKLSFKDSYRAEAADYFNRYSIYRNDELVLKGWWGFDTSR